MSHYQDRLRRLALNDARVRDDDDDFVRGRSTLDSRSLALARLASLIAIGGSEPSFGEHTDAALSAGASVDDIVDLLVGLKTVIGQPRIVSAAPRIAAALGVDLEGCDR